MAPPRRMRALLTAASSAAVASAAACAAVASAAASAAGGGLSTSAVESAAGSSAVAPPAAAPPAGRAGVGPVVDGPGEPEDQGRDRPADEAGREHGQGDPEGVHRSPSVLSWAKDSSIAAAGLAAHSSCQPERRTARLTDCSVIPSFCAAIFWLPWPPGLPLPHRAQHVHHLPLRRGPVLDQPADQSQHRLRVGAGLRPFRPGCAVRPGRTARGRR